MTTLFQLSHTINFDIQTQSAWLGNISGLKAEKLLRGSQTPYLYILREGEKNSAENETNYYVTFVLADLSIRHQPFVITETPEGWYSENYGSTGPHQNNVSIHTALHCIMHCNQNEPIPYIQEK